MEGLIFILVKNVKNCQKRPNFYDETENSIKQPSHSFVKFTYSQMVIKRWKKTERFRQILWPSQNM